MKKLAAFAVASLVSSYAHAADPAQLGDLGPALDCSQQLIVVKDGEASKSHTKYFHPFEMELMNGVRLASLDAALHAELLNPNSELGKKATAGLNRPALMGAFVQAVRPRLIKAAQAGIARSAGPLPKQRLARFDARLAVCRLDRIGKRNAFYQALTESEKTPKTHETSAAYWTAFSRFELQKYLSDAPPADGKPLQNWETLWTAMAARGKSALEEAADPVKQDARIKAAGLTYIVPAAATQPPPAVVQTPGAKTYPDLTGAEKAALAPADGDNKLLADYIFKRQQVIAESKDKTLQQTTEQMNALLKSYRAIGAARAKLSPEQRAQFDARIAATGAKGQERDDISKLYVDVEELSARLAISPQSQKDFLAQRDDVLKKTKDKPLAELRAKMQPVLAKYDGIAKAAAADAAKAAVRPDCSSSAYRQLQELEAQGGRRADCQPERAALALKEGPGSGDARTKEQIQAEEIARTQREKEERERAAADRKKGGIASPVGPSEPAANPNKYREIINGGKLGAWGALVGVLTLGPIGLILLGTAMVGLGFLMSKEANK